MTYGRDTTVLRDRFANFVIDKRQLKYDFEEYITNSEIFSLQHRWQMFLDAPDDLSNNMDSIYHGLDFVNDGEMFGETHHIGDKWYAALDERGSLISTLELVTDIESKNFEEMLYGFEHWECFKDPDLIVKIKEQLLKDNVKAFRYAW